LCGEEIFFRKRIENYINIGEGETLILVRGREGET
jgi:hypothetical protein